MDNKAYNPQRKIATIMAADIVAYSRLMRDNEQTTLNTLKIRRATFEHFVQEFGGRTFGTVGDSFMAEFPSALNGVHCAVNLQEAIKILNAPLPEKQRMRMRIGLNLGDVIRQGTDLFGDGVNIAARIETLADPGGVCLAGNVYEQVHRKLDLQFHFLGSQQVKNIDLPIATFKILNEGTALSSKWTDFINALKINKGFRYQLLLILAVTGFTATYIPGLFNERWKDVISLTVLFGSSAILVLSLIKNILTPSAVDVSESILDKNLIDDALLTIKGKQQFLGADLDTETGLEKIVPAIAVLRFSDLSQDKDQAYFSDGLTEELINVLAKTSNLNVTSRTSAFAFNPDEADAQKFAEQLEVDYFLEGSVRKDANRIRISAQLIEVNSNLHLWSETYDRVINDIFEIQDDISRKIADALQIKLNPKLDRDSLTSDSRAYDFYLRGHAFFGYKGIENIRYAIQMFSMAAKIDPTFIRAWTDLAETYAIQAIFYDGGTKAKNKAREIAGKVLLLAPERGETYVALGMAHLAQTEYGMAAARFEKAIALDPSLFQAYHNYARTHYHQGNFEEAIKYFEKAAAVDVNDFESYALCAPLYHGLGKKDDALNTYRLAVERVEKYIKDYPENQRAYQLGAIALLQLGNLEKANSWAEQALSLGPHDPATRYNLACFYAQAGNLDKAFECLDGSITSKSWIENDPELDPLRKDPRYAMAMEKLA